MSAPVTTESVWKVVEKQLFAVLGFVNPKGEARTSGIVYVAHERKIFIGTEWTSWKSRHIQKSPHVSLTVTIAKRIPFLPWIRIPAATITFSGIAEVLGVADVEGEVLKRLLHGLEMDDETRRTICVIRVKPKGDFVTYGVGVPLLKMRDTTVARGRAAVS